VRAITGALILLALLIVALDAAAARSGSKQLWGAIAYNSKTGAYGYAVDVKTKRDAETEAFRQCGSNCDQLHTFKDACGAVAAGKRAVYEPGASRQIAEARALAKCGDGCTIKVWACTSEK
jgi:hypothetical protein